MSAQATEIFPVDTSRQDHRATTLQRAYELWKYTALADRKEKLLCAAELYTAKLFSLNQLAKIVRLPVPTVARAMKKNSPGGRFSPDTLHSLTYVRRVVLTGEKIPMALVRSMVEAGTSISEISRLTGAPETQMYIRYNNQK
jgi:hypothetical protein